ncbi:MAG: nickel-dependent hydrogenase large subunit [Casimicrobiaceae bacterium]
MAIEGELIVRLGRLGHGVREVSIRSTRPMVAARLLTGKTAKDAAALVPKLFSICGGAQGAAANGALVAAGATGLVTDAAGRDREVMLESLQDAFWHLLLDWPNAMGSASCTTAVAAARALIAASMGVADRTPRLDDAMAMRELGTDLAAISEQAIFAMAPAAWLELADVEALRAWCARGETIPAVLLGNVLADRPMLGRSAIPLMPVPHPDALLRVIVPALRADPAFSRAPTWAGAPVETGALARMRNEPLVVALQVTFGNAAVTRIVARMAELARLTLELSGTEGRTELPMRIRSMPLEDGEGLAAVETARGLLLHRARVRDECVIDYQIVAPTEWNFHPDGALVRGLEGLEAEDESQLIRAAGLAVHTLDPCVACRVEAGHA